VKKLVLALLLACTAVAVAEPRKPEVLTQRPSGFWTSNRPAVGGAYRWRLLGLGVATVGVMTIVVMRLLRNARPPDRRS
jgi:hypothetical protein